MYASFVFPHPPRSCYTHRYNRLVAVGTLSVNASLSNSSRLRCVNVRDSINLILCIVVRLCNLAVLCLSRLSFLCKRLLNPFLGAKRSLICQVRIVTIVDRDLRRPAPSLDRFVRAKLNFERAKNAKYFGRCSSTHFTM